MILAIYIQSICFDAQTGQTGYTMFKYAKQDFRISYMKSFTFAVYIFIESGLLDCRIK